MKPTSKLLLPALALFLAAGIAGIAAPAAAQDGEALLERLRVKYATLETLQATFTQQTESDLFDEAESFGGTLFLRGEQYRLETGDRTLVNDGRTVWIYDALEQQVLVSDYEEDESTFSITGFLYRFDERYRLEGAERHGDVWHIRMSPLDPNDFFRSVTVHLREADDLVSRVLVEDANEVTLAFVLRDLVQNPPLSDDLFGFEAPEGVEIVDLRN